MAVGKDIPGVTNHFFYDTPHHKPKVDHIGAVTAPQHVRSGYGTPRREMKRYGSSASLIREVKLSRSFVEVNR